MRHVLANLAAYVLVAGLLLGAVLFAWVRSEQLLIAKATAVEPEAYASATDAEAFEWEAFGERVYGANCQNCHTVDGSGRGMYPPVQGMTAHLAGPGGREYLTHVVLYGLASGAHAAPMPPMPELSDAQVAAVNNYLLTRFSDWRAAPDSARLYVPADVRAQRGLTYSEQDVAARRPAVPLPAELGRGLRVPIETRAPAVPQGEDM